MYFMDLKIEKNAQVLLFPPSLSVVDDYYAALLLKPLLLKSDPIFDKEAKLSKAS